MKAKSTHGAVAAALWLLLLLAAPALALEAEDAARVWDEAVPEHAGAVLFVSFDPPAVQEGEQFRVHLTFAPGFEVEDVQYQICRVGEACFAIGVPLVQEGTTWSLDTRDLPLHTAMPGPRHFGAGERIGVQFFVFLPGMTEEDRLLFPPGLPEDDPLYEADFVAWSETHYFATTIAPGGRGLPGAALAWVVAAVAAAVLAARRRE